MISSSTEEQIKKKVVYLVLSDVHLGHPRNKTTNIINNLIAYFNNFSDRSDLAKLDILFIAGDLLDRLIDAGSDDLYEILIFAQALVNFCKRNRIRLRILEGTPSHDRRQSRLITSIASVMNNGADVKWISTVLIEKIEELDLSILYVPDEFTSSTEITKEIVKDVLKQNNLNQVDIAIMHGMFKYQMANIPGKHDVHDEDFYLSIVKHFINIGHIHTFSTFLRIIAQGSFDRLTQNEEEKKGAVKVTIRDDKKDYYEFIPNNNAKVFKTITLQSNDVDDALRQIQIEMKKVPDDSYIRIRGPKLHPLFNSFGELKRHYPFIHLNKITFEEETEHDSVKQKAEITSYSVVEIRPENVVNLILNEITNIEESDQVKLQMCLNNIQV